MYAFFQIILHSAQAANKLKKKLSMHMSTKIEFKILQNIQN